MLKFIFAFFIYVFSLLPLLVFSQGHNGNTNEDCNLMLSSLEKKEIKNSTANDYFELAICMYENERFNAAYDFFIKARSLNFTDKEELEKYLILCSIAMDDNENSLDLNPQVQAPDKTLLANNYKHTIQVHLLNLIFIIVAFTGIITALILFKKYKNNKSNIFLGIFVMTISFALLELVLFWQDFFEYSPTVAIYRVLFFLWAPSLYFYVKSKFIDLRVTNTTVILHYIPFIIVLISLVILGNFNVRTHAPENAFLDSISFIINDNWIKTVHLLIYLILIFNIFKYHKTIMQKNSKNWIKTLMVFILILILFLVTRAGFEHIYAFDYISKYFIAVYFILFISILAILLLIQPEVITELITATYTDQPTKDKYKNSGLTTTMSHQLKSQLEDLLEKDKIYLDNTLTLAKLAKNMNVDRYSLSQVINQELNKNFYELINDYRIKEAVSIIESKQEIQVVDLIYESGFNNKVSFYKAFKKRLDMTPKDYMAKTWNS
ncbi:transcriptional regulator, AraC family [Maribacter sedimenticola]|uniref:Transcriptional regulator, AraC family n=1 Tax=Maribacter sedimenticola TaxID=228956 RepID=A0ABY1SF81_9FLAO|nr:transcriptional regulator, AraC family [Maribacter sedimenticola]